MHLCQTLKLARHGHQNVTLTCSLILHAGDCCICWIYKIPQIENTFTSTSLWRNITNTDNEKKNIGLIMSIKTSIYRPSFCPRVTDSKLPFITFVKELRNIKSFELFNLNTLIFWVYKIVGSAFWVHGSDFYRWLLRVPVNIGHIFSGIISYMLYLVQFLLRLVINYPGWNKKSKSHNICQGQNRFVQRIYRNISLLHAHRKKYFYIFIACIVFHQHDKNYKIIKKDDLNIIKIC